MRVVVGRGGGERACYATLDLRYFYCCIYIGGRDNRKGEENKWNTLYLCIPRNNKTTLPNDTRCHLFTQSIAVLIDCGSARSCFLPHIVDSEWPEYIWIPRINGIMYHIIYRMLRTDALMRRTARTMLALLRYIYLRATYNLPWRLGDSRKQGTC